MPYQVRLLNGSPQLRWGNERSDWNHKAEEPNAPPDGTELPTRIVLTFGDVRVAGFEPMSENQS